MSTNTTGSSKPSGPGIPLSAIYSTTPPAPVDGQPVALQSDNEGNLLVNVAVGGGGGGSNASVGATGATAPTSATELGVIDVNGKLQGASAINPVRVDPTGTTTQPVSGTMTANAGTNLNTSALALDATLTGGTQKTKIVDTGGVNVALVSAAGAVKIDGSAVTQPVSGTVSLATATAVELLDSAGTNKASISAAGAVKVDGSAVTQPVSGNVNQAIGVAGFEKITDGSNTAVVKAASTGAAAADPSLVVALSPNSPIPTGTNTIGSAKVTDGTTVAGVIAGTTALKTDLSSVAGTGTSTAAAGVQKVGIVGSTGTALDSTSGVLDTNLKNVGGAAVSLGAKASASSIPVVLATDEAAVPTIGAANPVVTATWNNSTPLGTRLTIPCLGMGSVAVFIACDSGTFTQGFINFYGSAVSGAINVMRLIGMRQGQNEEQLYDATSQFNFLSFLQNNYFFNVDGFDSLAIQLNQAISGTGSVTILARAVAQTANGPATVGQSDATKLNSTAALYTNSVTTVAPRTPNIFKTASATASNNTAVWTPAGGKKFRLMRFKIDVTENANIAVGAVVTLSFQDASTPIGIAQDAFLPTTQVTTQLGDGFSSGWIDLGNGYLSAAANNALNINLSTTLSNGNIRVLVCGTEE